MKKSDLMELPKLQATAEMKQTAIEDPPIKEELIYGFAIDCGYGAYMRCQVWHGILKAAIFFPEHLKLDGNNPVYEVFVDKEHNQFITYDWSQRKWRNSKLDRLEWPKEYRGTATCWCSEHDQAVLQDYFSSDRKGAAAILKFQMDVKEKQLIQRHKRITDPWDADLAQIRSLPKDWIRWVDKVAIEENYIFYQYQKNGAKKGYCTFCKKEVPIKGHPYHNKMGRCSRCRRLITFKAQGRAKYVQTKRYNAYLIQRCKDGFSIRQFYAERFYWINSNQITNKVFYKETRRVIYGRNGNVRAYYWDCFKQMELRWIACGSCSPYWIGEAGGRVYGKTLPDLANAELSRTGLVDWIKRECWTDPEKYLAVHQKLPQMEQIWKANLSKLTYESFHSCNEVCQHIQKPEASGLIKALGLDAQSFKRLRRADGGIEFLEWLQYEKRTGKAVPDEVLMWFYTQKIRVRDISFIDDRMTPIQIRNYLKKQSQLCGDSYRQILITWEDYLSMAEKLDINTSDEIVYRARKLQQRHDELVMKMHEKEVGIQVEEVEKEFPCVNRICEMIKSKYEYKSDDYMVVAPQGIKDIIMEGRILNHCVDTRQRYWDRIERRESYILFLRKTSEPHIPYYTLEIEPDGTFRQKRTKFNRQNEDIKLAEGFLQQWQKVVASRLTAEDLRLAKKSRILREKEIVEMRKNQITIQTGDLAGQMLADVLLSDLMVNKAVEQAKEVSEAA